MMKSNFKANEYVASFFPEQNAETKMSIVGTFSRFLASGALNALVAITVLVAVQKFIGNAYLANTMAYITGGISGFYLHSRYTFLVPSNLGNGLRYLTIVLSGFLLNLIILRALTLSGCPIFASQLTSIFFYLCYSFVLQKLLLRS